MLTESIQPPCRFLNR